MACRRACVLPAEQAEIPLIVKSSVPVSLPSARNMVSRMCSTRWWICSPSRHRCSTHPADHIPPVIDTGTDDATGRRLLAGGCTPGGRHRQLHRLFAEVMRDRPWILLKERGLRGMLLIIGGESGVRRLATCVDIGELLRPAAIPVGVALAGASSGWPGGRRSFRRRPRCRRGTQFAQNLRVHAARSSSSAEALRVLEASAWCPPAAVNEVSSCGAIAKLHGDEARPADDVTGNRRARMAGTVLNSV